MFSSNQMFLISGDNDNNLRMALQCALGIMDDYIRGYIYDENHGLLLCSSSWVIEHNAKIIKIDTDEVGNFKYIYNMIKLYLCSKKYKDLLYKIGCNEHGDGSAYEGWIMGSCKESGIYDFSLFIKPFYAYYAK
jgi:hypothetical protein